MSRNWRKSTFARVLHRDGLMLVIDKPAGIPVHRGPRNSRDKSGTALEDFFDALRFGLPRPPVLAHRLDRDTSGCLVLGRHRKATASLGLLFKHNKISKTYWAVVEGGPDADEGTIDIPLGRLNEERGWWQKPDPNGLPSTTNWKVLGRIGDETTDMACARAGHRPHASAARALRGDGLADRRRRIYGTAPREGGDMLHLHAREISVPLSKNKPPVQVAAPVPEHMRERLLQCGWNVAATRDRSRPVTLRLTGLVAGDRQPLHAAGQRALQSRPGRNAPSVPASRFRSARRVSCRPPQQAACAAPPRPSRAVVAHAP